MLRHQSVLIDQPDFFDGGHDQQLAMGVLDWHGVRVVVEPNQRLGIGRSIRNTSRLERLLGQWKEGGLVVPQQVALGGGLAAGPLSQIGQTTLSQRVVQRRERINLGHWYQEVTPREPHKSLDVALLVGPPYQAEVLLEQVMALQPQELLGQLALAPLEHLDHRDGQVIVADPPWHTAEELERPAMPLQEGLRAFPWKSLNEDRSRVRQRHHEQGRLSLHAIELNGGFAEVDLRFARWMRKRQKDLLM
jgi:hypothetical protein